MGGDPDGQGGTGTAEKAPATDIQAIRKLGPRVMGASSNALEQPLFLTIFQSLDLPFPGQHEWELIA